MAEFAEYYEATWVGNDHTAPRFNVMMWNQFDAVLAKIPRSSNIAEGWHNGFSSMMGCKNPTLWKFLEVLKDEQVFTDVKLTKYNHREDPEPRKKKWVNLDNRLSTFAETYEIEEMLDYMKYIGNVLY